MCGIAGVVGKNNSAEIVELMLDRIKHRGPDGRGMWQNEAMAFGHLRLSIIDLSENANQPMIDGQTGNVIIFNGEIYNYKELRKPLESVHKFVTNSDTEVILAAYKAHGVDCLRHLRGMFALAIYDASKREVFIARDRLGIKPLYLRTIDNATLFCSEMKGLVHLLNADHHLNYSTLGKFFGYRQLDTNDETFIREITQLPPAHFAIIDSSGRMSSPQRYWHLPKHGRRKFDYLKDHEEFISRLKEAVYLHLRADVEVGSFVSGGIDSSTIASLAKELQTNPILHTFSAILPKATEENALIHHITNQPGIKKHEFLLDGKDFFKDLESVIYYHDEPLLDGSMYSHYKLCQLANRAGIKVVLSGAGGDELFGGYLSHVTAYLGSLTRTLKPFKLYNSIQKISANSDYSKPKLFLKALQEALPVGVKQYYKGRQFDKNLAYLNIDEKDLNKEFYYSRSNNPWTNNFENNYQNWTVPPYLHYEDRNSMAFGVEVRVPFYDHELIEYVSGFDPGALMNGASKSLVRNNLKGVVPHEILTQKGKYGFPTPVDEILQHSKVPGEMLLDLSANLDVFDKRKVEWLAKNYQDDKSLAGLFWRCLSFSIWHNTYFKKLTLG